MRLKDNKDKKMQDPEFTKTYNEIQPEIEAIRAGMNREYETGCLSTLDTVLRDHFPATWYSICNEKESSACIEREDQEWIVYDVERGNRFDIERYDHVVEACLAFIRRVGGKDQAARLIDDFLSMVIDKTHGDNRDEPAWITRLKMTGKEH